MRIKHQKIKITKSLGNSLCITSTLEWKNKISTFFCFRMHVPNFLRHVWIKKWFYWKSVNKVDKYGWIKGYYDSKDIKTSLIFSIGLILVLKNVYTFHKDCPNWYTVHKMKFSIKDYFFSKCDQTRSLLQIWSFLLKKSLMVNLIFCAVTLLINDLNHHYDLLWNDNGDR